MSMVVSRESSIAARLGLALAFLVATMAIACGKSSQTPPACTPGTERCDCYGNGTCNAGLQCLSKLCVATAGTGGVSGTGGQGATAGAGGAMTGGATGAAGSAAMGSAGTTGSAG